MNILVGHTGFVGSNLHRQGNFSGVFHSKNIRGAYGTRPDLCIYSGVRAEKFRADRFPEEDLRHIKEALQNIREIDPQKLVLISTVDVIPHGQEQEVYEHTPYDSQALTPYGQNRLFLEEAVRGIYPDALVVRLPALFGTGLKKNFIYDLIKRVPAMLKKGKFEELRGKEGALALYYQEDENGFFRIRPELSPSDTLLLKQMFANLGFSAIHFTDSRSNFSFYNLDYLWEHIHVLLENNVHLAHMATEPIGAASLYSTLYGADFVNEIQDRPFDYSFFKTAHTALLGGQGGYLFPRHVMAEEIEAFIKQQA